MKIGFYDIVLIFYKNAQWTILLLSWNSSTSAWYKSISELELNTRFNLTLLTNLKLVEQIGIFYQSVMTAVYYQSKKHQLIKIFSCSVVHWGIFNAFRSSRRMALNAIFFEIFYSSLEKTSLFTLPCFFPLLLYKVYYIIQCYSLWTTEPIGISLKHRAVLKEPMRII